MDTRLHHYFEEAIVSHGVKTYIQSSTESLSYQQLIDLSHTFSSIFIAHGLLPQDRVVVYSSKNAASIAMMVAVSRGESIYIPISSINPIHRAALIIDETTPRFIVCDRNCSEALSKTDRQLTKVYEENDTVIFLNELSSPISFNYAKAIAFILFTSGSTGVPKGVAISHHAAKTFIDWAADTFNITEEDRLSSIAPFNFDLSVFDIYVTAKKKATLLLYTEDETKNALLMAQRLDQDEVTTIYGTPTFFTTLAYYGKMHKYVYARLKNVFFAGEVFLPENFNKLLEYWKDKSFVNLYGPTETNVCTYYEVQENLPRHTNFPIGKLCDYATGLILDDKDHVLTNANEEGELLIGGDSLFDHYWNDNTKTEAALFIDQFDHVFYRTGDIVSLNTNGEYVYIARKDRMIKKNGYRIEPSEIEKVVVNYPNVSHAAVLFSKEKNQLFCFMESRELLDKQILEVKIFCQNYLPSYMIPDKFVTLTLMPKTSSGKIDLQALKSMIA